jgi:transcriptional regulator of nitric oxide reductase
MLRTSSLFGPINSGFVPFASGAPVDAPAEHYHDDADSAEAVAAEVVARAAAIEVPTHIGVAPWAPASSARIRIVEAAVLVAICAYFGWGLVRTFAGF